MSHFAVFAVVNTNQSQTGRAPAIQAALDALLAPYDEDLSVPPYETECSCVGLNARRAAREAADNVRPISDYGAVFNAEHAEPVDSSEASARDAQWQQFIQPYVAFVERAEREHPAYQQPDPTCEECHGSGKVMSQYPRDVWRWLDAEGREVGITYGDKVLPEMQRTPSAGRFLQNITSSGAVSQPVRKVLIGGAKWDWFQVGGRWTGMLDDYDPQDDPANMETCDLCGGTGRRDDELARERRRIDPDYSCNGCQGIGTRLKWPTQWGHHKGDVQPLAKVVAILNGPKNDQYLPFAIVSQEGWVERGSMGWWGVVSNGKAKDDWAKQARAVLATLLEKNPAALVCVCDCHI